MATVVLRTKVILKLSLVSGKFIFTLCRELLLWMLLFCFLVVAKLRELKK